MTFKDVTQLPLWEHAAESGRFAEYVGAANGLQPWSLIGKGLISCLTLVGGVADVVHLGGWSTSAEPASEAAAEADPMTSWIGHQEIKSIETELK